MPDICGIMMNSQNPTTAVGMVELSTCLPQRRVEGDIVRTAFQSSLHFVSFWQDLRLHSGSCIGRSQKSRPVVNVKSVHPIPILNPFWKSIRTAWRISLGGVGRLTFEVIRFEHHLGSSNYIDIRQTVIASQKDIHSYI